MATAVVARAYLDYCEALAVYIVDSNPHRSKNTEHKLRVITTMAVNRAKEVERDRARNYKRNCKKGSARAEIYKPRTDVEFSALAAEIYDEIVDETMNIGDNALRFLKSNRLSLFCDTDGEYLIRTANERVQEWADGKIDTYTLQYTRAQMQAMRKKAALKRGEEWF